MQSVSFSINLTQGQQQDIDYVLSPTAFIQSQNQHIATEPRNQFSYKSDNLQSVLPARFAGTIVVQNIWVCSTNVWFNLSLSPRQAAHVTHWMSRNWKLVSLEI